MRRDPDPREAAARFERQLLARLGLGDGASNEQIEAAHEEVVKFLEAAPASLRSWSLGEVAAADEAYALLRGPRADLLAAVPGLPELTTSSPAATLARPRGGQAPDREILGDEVEDWLDDGEAAAAVATTRKGKVAVNTLTAARRTSEPRLAKRTEPVGNGRTIRRALMGAVAAVAVVIVVVAVYTLGAPSVPGFTGSPAPESSAGAVDTTKVAALMEKLAANPKDVATLQALGDAYYAGGDYATAATWMQKILDIEPGNVTALLALGAAKFNVGSSAEAEAAWRKVLEIEPKSLEAHYDLGFMYLSKNPPDLEQVRAEWNQVIAIAPDSDVAKTVATHLKSLDGSPSPAPSGSVAPSATPAATPAPSPSGNGG